MVALAHYHHGTQGLHVTSNLFERGPEGFGLSCSTARCQARSRGGYE
jgi:hypothetical protein